LKDLDLDFLVLFSSITSVVTPYAEADYSAANSFLDAFAHFANSHGRCRTLAINWPGWREVGQLVKLKALAGVEAWKQNALKKAILTADGLEAFRRALESDLTQVVVTPEPLDALLEESRKPVDISQYFSGSVTLAAAAPIQGSRIAAPDRPANELEGLIAETWKRVLGMAEVGVNENFFDLGGHSLLLIRVHAELRRAMNRDISIISLFQHPTIAAMAGHLAAGDAKVAPSNAAQERAERFKQALSMQRSMVRK
jgi:aryl carrier-like protein